MRRIAITGGVAEGKSTVLGYLRAAGYPVDSADLIARRVFERDDVQQAMGSALGLRLPVEPSQVRERLTDAKSRRMLNGITHPRILEELMRGDTAFIEVPLLLETCIQGYFHRVWVVTCGHAEQVRRLAERLGSADYAESLISAQLPTRMKIAFADTVVRTNREESTVKRFVTEAAQRDLR